MKLNQFTILYNLPQSGKAERFNATFISSTKTLFNESELPYDLNEYARIC